MSANGSATKQRKQAKPANRLPLTKKVALIGKAPSSVGLAPYDDASWDIWILNTLGSNREVPRWDRQYELHELDLTKDKAYGNYYPWLREQSHGSRPIFLRDTPPDEFGPAAKAYPLQEIRRHFQHLAGCDYLTNTVSLMLVHALWEHATGQTQLEELGLWGIDMAQHGVKFGHAGWFTSEYARQRPSCEYWIGIAEGLGIKVHVPPTSDLLKTSCIYGYHHSDKFKKTQARRTELQQRIAGAQQLEQAKHDEALFLSGALEAMNYHSQWDWDQQ